jgi:hypothetical protein
VNRRELLPGSRWRPVTFSPAGRPGISRK